MPYHLIAAIIIFLIIVIFIVYQVALYFIDKTLFIPVKEMVWKPEQNYEDVYFESPGLIGNLNGWLIKNRRGRNKIVLFCHGNTGNISHRKYIVELTQLIHVDLFLFDYRGYGNSSGYPTLSSLCQDAVSAYRYLLSVGYNPDDIIIWGESIGGYPAIYVAEKEKADRLLLLATFADLPTLARESSSNLAKLAAPILSRLADSNVDRIGRVKIPTLIVHSHNDDIIPYHHSQKLYNAIKHDHKKHIAITGGHSTPRLNKDILNEMTDFCHLKRVKNPYYLEIFKYIADEKVKHGR